MIGLILKYTFRFIILFLLQVFVLNHVNLWGMMHPYLYIFFILFLPVRTPHWVVLLSSFLMGLCVDFFLHTPGIHAGASVLTGFLRIFVFRLFKSPEDVGETDEPHVPVIALGQFLFYIGFLTLVHHTFLYLVEAFNFGSFIYSLRSALITSVFTFFTILITEMIFFYNSKQSGESIRK